MNQTKFLDFNPYSSVKMDIQTFEEGSEVLEKILTSDVKILPRRIDKQIILYGAGNLGKMAKKFFDYLNIPFLYFVDKNSDKQKLETDWSDINIIHPDQVKEADKKNCLLIVCIVTTQLIALRDELKSDGWEDIAFFYDVCEAYSDRYPLSNGWFLNKPSENEIDNIKKVFSALDDISRLHYLQFFAWRRLRIELLLKGIQIINNRYFIPEITDTLHENEVFVDCGAHVGSVINKFVEATNGKYNKIYAIEADKNNFTVLEDNLRNIPNSATIKCALSDKNGEEKFYQGFDYASKLNKFGNETVEITTLDSFNISATFIKIHLEGGELRSLTGAKNTIQKYRPILTVTIYHNPDGVWKIPLCLMNCVQNYIYYIRLDSWGGTGAVFYAIPKERYNKVLS
jgi:FkbM family methyltransferase